MCYLKQFKKDRRRNLQKFLVSYGKIRFTGFDVCISNSFGSNYEDKWNSSVEKREKKISEKCNNLKLFLPQKYYFSTDLTIMLAEQ